MPTIANHAVIGRFDDLRFLGGCWEGWDEGSRFELCWAREGVRWVGTWQSTSILNWVMGYEIREQRTGIVLTSHERFGSCCAGEFDRIVVATHVADDRVSFEGDGYGIEMYVRGVDRLHLQVTSSGSIADWPLRRMAPRSVDR